MTDKPRFYGQQNSICPAQKRLAQMGCIVEMIQHTNVNHTTKLSNISAIAS